MLINQYHYYYDYPINEDKREQKKQRRIIFEKRCETYGRWFW